MCNGLQSKPARTAISAFSGSHSLHLSPCSGPHSLQLRLQSAAWACNPSPQDHISCNGPGHDDRASWHMPGADLSWRGLPAWAVVDGQGLAVQEDGVTCSER